LLATLSEARKMRHGYISQ